MAGEQVRWIERRDGVRQRYHVAARSESGISLPAPSDPTGVTYEDRALPPLDNPDAYPRQYVQDRKTPYRAAVVPPIADARFSLTQEVLAAADDATSAIVRFDSEYTQFPAPFAAVLLRSESASSSQIEQLTAGARAIAEAAIGERAEGNGPIVASNVRAMEAAVALADQLDDATIITMHQVLLGDHAPRLTGRYRQEQVWIGGRLPQDAAFVPPHHERVPAAMADLLSFAKRTDLPVLVHTAIAHAQFETIHPFPDGNGRTGRAIIQSMLRHARLIRHMTIPVSAGLLSDLSRYHAALDDFQRGDPNPIVAEFSQAAFAGLTNARQLATDLHDLESSWTGRLSGLRSDAAARRLAVATMSQPVVNLRVATATLGVSQPAASNALDQLVDRGILSPGNSKRRNRIWVNQEVIATLDAFAARATRRQGRYA